MSTSATNTWNEKAKECSHKASLLSSSPSSLETEETRITERRDDHMFSNYNDGSFVFGITKVKGHVSTQTQLTVHSMTAVKVTSVSFYGAFKIGFSWHSSEIAPLRPMWIMKKVKEWTQFLQSGTFTVNTHFVYYSQDNFTDLIKGFCSVSSRQMMSWARALSSVLWRLISSKVWWWSLRAARSPWLDKQI